MATETHTDIPTVYLCDTVDVTTSRALWSFFNGSTGHPIISTNGKHSSLAGTLTCVRDGKEIPSSLMVTKDKVTIVPDDLGSPFTLIYNPTPIVVYDNRLVNFIILFGSGLLCGAGLAAAGVAFYRDVTRD